MNNVDMACIIFLIIVFLPIGYYALTKWFEHSEHKVTSRKADEENNYIKNKNYYSPNTLIGYNDIPIVTGDYFKRDSWLSINDKFFCAYAGTTNCANCSRRKQTTKEGKLYFGASADCYEYDFSD